MKLERKKILRIVEAALLASPEPLSLQRLKRLFGTEECPSDRELHSVLQQLASDCTQRAYNLQQVAGGFRYCVREDYAPWVGRLWEQRPQRYSRALLEVLALIAYRQPITRGQIEEVRGVSVGASILNTLFEREWIQIVGHREVPGRPALYATTRKFLDELGLSGLEGLPPLSELSTDDPPAGESAGPEPDAAKDEKAPSGEAQALVGGHTDDAKDGL